MAPSERTIKIEAAGISDEQFNNLALAVRMIARTHGAVSNFTVTVTPDRWALERDLDQLWRRYGDEKKRWG